MQNSYDQKPPGDDNSGDVPEKSSGTKVLSRTTLGHLTKTHTSSSLRDHAKDKELINTGLHKLLSSFHNGNKLGQKPSNVNTANKKCLSKPSIVNNSENRRKSSHIMLTKQESVDKYTMTDLEDQQRRVDMESSIFTEEPCSAAPRDLQWTDPRLLKKYSMIKQPYKKSLTEPLLDKSEFESEIETTVEEDNGTEMMYSKSNHLLFKFLYHFCMASVSFIGSLCGITLITIVIWKVLDENILNFEFSPPRSDYFLTRYISNYAVSVINMLATIMRKMLHILTVPTSEVFGRDEDTNWYFRYF